MKAIKTQIPSQSSRHCAIRAVSTNMMTLRHKPEEVRRSMLSVSSKEKKACTEDREEDSAGSSEEMESPRSVGRWRTGTTKKTGCVLHSQILRIREEDSHLGESTALIGAAAASGKDYHGIDVVLFARPILPSSPLKNTING
ncbi:hypothetical protein EV1_044697 [Malus domestica]